MSHVSGPVASLPNSVHKVRAGAVCDTHSERSAVVSVQGETDSFGAEYIHMCQECYSAHLNRDRTVERIGHCEWCGKHATDLAVTRDYDEGMSGPVYRVCGACRKKASDAAAEELEYN